MSNQPIIFDIQYTPYRLKKNATEKELAAHAEARAFYDMTGTKNVYRYITTEGKRAGKGANALDYLQKSTGVFNGNGMLTEKEAAAIVAHCSQQIAKGITCCVSTKRVVLTLPDDTPEAALVRSVAISDALQSCVGRLTASPAFVVAKGGITSSDVGVKALRVKCAKVLGQIRPGIPVWQTGAESLFPGTPYIIFPGNVGEVSTLREAVEILLG